MQPSPEEDTRLNTTYSAKPQTLEQIPCDLVNDLYEAQNRHYWHSMHPGNILALYAGVCFFGAVANAFVIVTFASSRRLRTLRNYFIVNLAFSDLMLCVLTAPATLYQTMNLFWPFGSFACQMVATVQAVNLFVSCLTLVLVALDRVLLTLFPHKMRAAVKGPLVCYCVVWLTALAVATPYFSQFRLKKSLGSALGTTWISQMRLVYVVIFLLRRCRGHFPQLCLENAWHRMPFSRRTYTLSVLALQYILPLCALGAAYLRIGSTMLERVRTSSTMDRKRKRRTSRRNRKSLLLLLLLVLVYAIAWLPMNAYNVLNVFEVIEFSQYRYLFCHLVGMTSTCMNPIMYALVNESFRREFARMLPHRPRLLTCLVRRHSKPANKALPYLRPRKQAYRWKG